MAFIEPLQLGTWIPAVFAGSADIFVAVALAVIFGMAGYFRMNLLATFFMIAVFLLMFSAYISSPIILLIAIIGSLLIGRSLSKLF